MFEKIKESFKKLTSKPKPKTTSKSSKNPRQQAAAKLDASKKMYVNKNKNLNARIKHTTKKDVPSFKKAASVGLKVLDAIDKPRNAVMNAWDDSKRGENSFKQGFKEGWQGKERVDGGDLLKRAGVDKKVTKVLTKVGVSKKTANNAGKVTKAVGGVAVDALTDPLNYLTLGGGSLVKGALTGVGGTLTKETLEKGATTAGRHILRTQGKKAITKDIAESALKKHSKSIAKVNQGVFDKTIDDMVTKGASNIHKATSEHKVARAVYDDIADSVAKRNKIDLQKMTNRQTGKGVSVAGKELVSANKMRDWGADFHKATIGKTELGKKLSENLNETFIRGYKKGMDVDTLTMTRLIDQNQRGLQEKLLTDHVDKIKNTSANTSKKGDQDVAKALDRGGKYAERLKGKDLDAYNKYKSMLDNIGDQEVAHNLLDKKRGDYLPHVKSLKHEAAAPWTKAATLNISDLAPKNKQFGKSFNPYSQTRKLDLPVNQANKIIAKEHGLEDYFETSAAKAIAQRSVDSAKNISRKTAVDDVLENFGQRLEGQDLAQALGKRGPLSETHAVVVPKQQVASMVIDPNSGTTLANILEQSSELMSKADMSPGDAVRSVISTLPPRQYPVKEIENVLNGLRTKEHVIDAVSNPGLINDLHVLQQVYGTGPSYYAVPKNVIDQFVTAPQAKEGIVETAAGLSDMFNYAWKPLKTKFSPGYHVRNAVGGNASMLADLGPRALSPGLMSKADTVIKGAPNDTVTLGGRKYTVGMLRDFLASNNVLASTYHRGDLNTIAKQLDMELSKGGNINVISKIADNIGNSIEENLRTRHFLGALDSGMDPLTAATTVKKYQIDYQDLTDVEKNVLRRLQAFYTFSSKNLPLQVTNFLDKPGGALNNAYRLSNETGEEFGVDPSHMPGYMSEQLPVWFGKDNFGQAMNANFSLPQTEPLTWLPDTTDSFTAGLFKPGKQIIDKGNPLLKAGFELSMGRSLFTGEELEESERNLVAYGLNMFDPAGYLKYGNEDAMAGKTRQPHIQTAGVTSSYNKDAAEFGSLYERNQQLEAFKKSLGNVPGIYDVRKSQGYKARNDNTPMDKAALLQEKQGMGITPVNVSGGAVKQFAADKKAGKILPAQANNSPQVQYILDMIEKLKNRG